MRPKRESCRARSFSNLFRVTGKSGIEIRTNQEHGGKFWHGYTGYKHGQYATPVVLTMNVLGTEPKQEWGLYLIPKSLRRDTAARKVHTGNRFINTADNVGLFYNLAVECVGLSLETRGRQYLKVFGYPLP